MSSVNIAKQENNLDQSSEYILTNAKIGNNSVIHFYEDASYIKQPKKTEYQ